MAETITVNPKRKPVLDPGFIPAVLWNNAFQERINTVGGGEKLTVAVERTSGAISAFPTTILPHTEDNASLNLKYVERLVKALLWVKGGYKVTIAGNEELATTISAIYAPEGKQKFDHEFMGLKIYGKPFEICHCAYEESPETKEIDVALGGNFDGCRIGFDLGGSDRKSAAVIDGEVVFSEEIEWDPYFEKNPQYHLDGIRDTLKRAAEKLPRVDAIGGSAAGVYVNNQVRAASLFRGVSELDFKKHVVNMFLDLQKEWENIPFVVANDGDVTALAGAMEMKTNAILGLSMGTSQAAGYINTSGNITDWLNELAFAPVDYRDNAPVDEWSGDGGCGVQYFSQQAVARLAPTAGLDFPEEMPFPERLVEVQKLMNENDERARKIYESIGTYFGYAIAHYAEFYEIRNLLILGRVTSGAGGEIILSGAEDVLKTEFPDLAEKVTFRTPDEKSKRHGQAVAAASLPSLK